MMGGQRIATDKVKVRALLIGGGVDWEVNGIKAKQSKLKLGKDSGPHELDFRLDDDTGLGLSFDTSDPIWVAEDGPCPPPPGINSDQISVTRCSADNLIALDANSGRSRELRYQLNFISGDGQRELCDPIIENGGGTQS
jgi:hypothetical protein